MHTVDNSATTGCPASPEVALDVGGVALGEELVGIQDEGVGPQGRAIRLRPAPPLGLGLVA